MEHDFYVGLALVAVLATIVKNVGPDYTAYINKELDNDEAGLRKIRQGEIDLCKEQIAHEELAQANGAAWEDIIAAKKRGCWASARGRIQGEACSCTFSGEEEVGLSTRDGKCVEANGAEAHGGLDHLQREAVNHPRPGNSRPQEVYLRPEGALRCLICSPSSYYLLVEQTFYFRGQ